MKRREFISLIAGAAAAWPLAARAQQTERVRRVGVLSNFAESDLEAQSMVEALHQTLQELGWVEGRNLRFDHRWAAGNSTRAAHAPCQRRRGDRMRRRAFITRRSPAWRRLPRRVILFL